MVNEKQVEQLLASNELLISVLESDRKDRAKTKRVSIVCCTVCMVCVLLVGGLLAVLAAGIEIDHSTTTTEETTQTVEGDNATINNGTWEQYNDNAVNGGGN